MAITLVALVSCEQKKTILQSPPHYNFQNANTTELNLEIKEISGLIWESTRNQFIAHNDESGKLFYLHRDTKAITHRVTFAGTGDFEDIALVGTTPYVLKSDGTIYRVLTDSSQGRPVGEELGKLPIEGKVDFETMYYDSSRHALVLLCKNCDVDSKVTVSAFAYYVDSIGFSPEPIYRINAAQVDTMAPKKTSKLQPSAARINPRLNKLFVISSAANLLVITDLDGRVESVFRLAPKKFPQPEGLTFNKSGDMYISNEGVTGKATIHSFTYTE
jgi:uncharacterized protein YjiK